MGNYNSFLGGLIFGSDSGTPVSFAIDTGMLFLSHGDSIGFEHSCIEALSDQTLKLHLYVSATNGNPDSNIVYVYLPAGTGDDIDRPDTSTPVVQFTSTTVGFVLGWNSMNIPNMHWPSSRTIWMILANLNTAPTVNFPTIQIRGGLDGPAGLAVGVGDPATSHKIWSNTSGWVGDGVGGAGTVAPYVVEYPSGKSYGNPYVSAAQPPAANQNFRGDAITPTENLTISGFWGSPDSNLGSMHIYDGTTDLLNYNISTDLNSQQRAGGMRFDAITLTGGTTYFLLQKATANDAFGSFFNMGTGAYQAVINAGGALRYAAGSTLATTTSNDQFYYQLWVEVADNPVISSSTGGGGTSIIASGVWGF